MSSFNIKNAAELMKVFFNNGIKYDSSTILKVIKKNKSKLSINTTNNKGANTILNNINLFNHWFLIKVIKLHYKV